MPKPFIHRAARGLFVLVAATGLARAGEPAAPAEPALPENSFIRFVEDENLGRLETAVTTYVNPDGVKVDLVGAIHIGDEAYYTGLNELFKGYEVVLYELVGKPEEVEAGKDAKEPAGKDAGKDAGKNDLTARILKGSQLALVGVLGLQHQMMHVDYTPANFVHADVTWEKFREMQKAKGENLFTMARKSMEAQKKLEKERKQAGVRPAAGDEGLAMLLALFKAAREDNPTELKLIMARQMQDAERMMGHMDGEDGGSVIINERNKIALEKFDTQVEGGKKNLAIFYGAAHFPDMEKRLLERGFKPRETRWRTAWEIQKKPAPAREKNAA